MSATIDSNPPLDLYCPTCELGFAGGELCPTDGTRLVRLGAAVDPLVGRDLDGRYTIVEKLGAGGMGAVYRATQHSVGREVAVKVVNPSLTSDLVAVKRFLREAKLASRLAHPNIVAVLDFGQTREGVFYLVMELIEGESLHALVQRERRLETARVVRIALQICDALEGAHKLPIIHRDLKPANIMMLDTGRDLLKVVDFGLAKSLVADNASTTMTSAGALVGTPAFMPPELANGGICDERSDLYSLGCILYLLGSGRSPFVTDSVPEMIALHALEPAPPMTGLPPALAHVIDRLLEKDPARRYPDAATLRAAIEDAHDSSRGFTPIAKAGDDVLMSGDTAKTREGKTAVFVGPPPPLSLPPAPSTPAKRADLGSQLAPRAVTARAAETMPEGVDSLRPRGRLRVGIFAGIAIAIVTVAIVVTTHRRPSSSAPASTITIEPIESSGSASEPSSAAGSEAIAPRPPPEAEAITPPSKAVTPPTHAPSHPAGVTPPKPDRQAAHPKVTAPPPEPVPAPVVVPVVPVDAGDKPPPF